VSSALAQLGKEITEAARGLCHVATGADFACDFTSFARGADLKWIDVSPPPFERFKFSSRFAAPDVCVIERFSLLYFPIRLVRARADFEAQSQEELPLRRGQRVWLMQPVRDQWVFVMAGTSEACGFVPSAFIDVIGVGIAAVLPGAAGARPGKLVAVMGEGAPGYVVCEDLRGRRIELARDVVAII
jgi:hypothetical protein